MIIAETPNRENRGIETKKRLHINNGTYEFFYWYKNEVIAIKLNCSELDDALNFYNNFNSLLYV